MGISDGPRGFQVDWSPRIGRTSPRIGRTSPRIGRTRISMMLLLFSFFPPRPVPYRSSGPTNDRIVVEKCAQTPTRRSGFEIGCDLFRGRGFKSGATYSGVYILRDRIADLSVSEPVGRSECTPNLWSFFLFLFDGTAVGARTIAHGHELSVVDLLLRCGVPFAELTRC